MNTAYKTNAPKDFEKKRKLIVLISFVESTHAYESLKNKFSCAQRFLPGYSFKYTNEYTNARVLNHIKSKNLEIIGLNISLFSDNQKDELPVIDFLKDLGDLFDIKLIFLVPDAFDIYAHYYYSYLLTTKKSPISPASYVDHLNETFFALDNNSIFIGEKSIIGNIMNKFAISKIYTNNTDKIIEEIETHLHKKTEKNNPPEIKKISNSIFNIKSLPVIHNIFSKFLSSEEFLKKSAKDRDSEIRKIIEIQCKYDFIFENNFPENFLSSIAQINEFIINLFGDLEEMERIKIQNIEFDDTISEQAYRVYNYD